MDPLFDLEGSLPNRWLSFLFAEETFGDSQIELEIQNEDLKKIWASWLSHHPGAHSSFAILS